MNLITLEELSKWLPLVFGIIGIVLLVLFILMLIHVRKLYYAAEGAKRAANATKKSVYRIEKMLKCIYDQELNDAGYFEDDDLNS